MVGSTAYAVLGSADFGAGFWDLTAGGDRRGGRVRGMIQRSMSPVWEANHVWLIFVLVVVWTAFPVAFGSIFSTLSIPLFLAALGIIFRGAAFALRGQAGTIREARVLGALFASSSVLIPFCLGGGVGGIASGRVPVGNAAGDAVVVVAEPDLGADRRARRGHRRAPRRGLPGGRTPAAPGSQTSCGRSAPARSARARWRGLALGGLLVVRSDARELFDGLTSGAGLGLRARVGRRRRRDAGARRGAVATGPRG